MYGGARTRCRNWNSKNLVLWNLPILTDLSKGLEIFSFSVLFIVGSAIKLHVQGLGLCLHLQIHKMQKV